MASENMIVMANNIFGCNPTSNRKLLRVVNILRRCCGAETVTQIPLITIGVRGSFNNEKLSCLNMPDKLTLKNSKLHSRVLSERNMVFLKLEVDETQHPLISSIYHTMSQFLVESNDVAFFPLQPDAFCRIPICLCNTERQASRLASHFNQYLKVVGGFSRL